MLNLYYFFLDYRKWWKEGSGSAGGGQCGRLMLLPHRTHHQCCCVFGLNGWGIGPLEGIGWLSTYAGACAYVGLVASAVASREREGDAWISWTSGVGSGHMPGDFSCVRASVVH